MDTTPGQQMKQVCQDLSTSCRELGDAETRKARSMVQIADACVELSESARACSAVADDILGLYLSWSMPGGRLDRNVYGPFRDAGMLAPKYRKRLSSYSEAIERYRAQRAEAGAIKN